MKQKTIKDMHTTAIIAIALIVLASISIYYNIYIANNSYAVQVGISATAAIVIFIAALFGLVACVLSLAVVWVKRRARDKHFWLAAVYLLLGIGCTILFTY